MAGKMNTNKATARIVGVLILLATARQEGVHSFIQVQFNEPCQYRSKEGDE
jgi:hypothetical protein